MTRNRPPTEAPMPRATQINDVAKKAGVSPATVSRVLNGRATVDKMLATRVSAAIKEMNYTPNPQGRSLRSGRSRTLGLLISEITNPFFPELIQSFEGIAVANGFEVMVGSTNYNSHLAKAFITRLVQRRVEGVAVMTFRDEAQLVQDLIAADIPLVSIDVAISSPRSVVLTVDYNTGIDQAVQHLITLGHRDLAFASGPMPHITNLLRKQSFLDSISKSGLQSRKDWLYEGPHTLEGGMEAAEQFLQAKRRPTAIVCSNDMMAVGVLRVLAKNLIRVPQEMSVVGFDDIHLAEFVTPALTTVRMSREALAVAAFNALSILTATSIRDEQPTLSVATTLVVRESTDRTREFVSRSASASRVTAPKGDPPDLLIARPKKAKTKA